MGESLTTIVGAVLGRMSFVWLGKGLEENPTLVVGIDDCEVLGDTVSLVRSCVAVKVGETLGGT